MQGACYQPLPTPTFILTPLCLPKFLPRPQPFSTICSTSVNLTQYTIIVNYWSNHPISPKFFNQKFITVSHIYISVLPSPNTHTIFYTVQTHVNQPNQQDLTLSPTPTALQIKINTTFYTMQLLFPCPFPFIESH